MATCKRCGKTVEDVAVYEHAECGGGELVDACVICASPGTRGEELRRCVGCGDWLCGRAQCSRDGYENLARRLSGRVCARCARRREIVPRAGAGKGAGSAAGVEAVERGRYYLLELSDDVERRLRAVTGELEAATGRQLEAAGEKLGRALEEALARGLARGAEAARGQLGVLRAPLIVFALLVLVANGVVTLGIILLLR